MIKLLEIYNSLNQNKYQIYLDMDGVLADFDSQFKNLTGLLPKDFEQKYGIEKFWSVIPTNTSKFWSGIPWMPDGKKLRDYTSKYNPTILTAPSRHKSSEIGKTEWRDKNMSGVKMIFKGAKFKHELATPNSILVDDRKDNIERWSNAGGIGILHTSTQNTIAQLKKLGL